MTISKFNWDSHLDYETREKPVVMDGTFTETKEVIAGFILLM
ncbi:hypothetical protein ACFSO7_09150 [Bacillus sp. CGMCC 1.16607]